MEEVTLTIKYTPAGIEVQGPTGNPPVMLWMLRSAEFLMLQQIYGRPIPPPASIIPASEMMTAGLDGGHPFRR